MRIVYRTEENVVRAYEGKERIGQVTVPDIDFQWADGVHVLMAGISGVGTQEAYRRRGIAAAMMEEAVAFSTREGYASSGITTAHGSVARRLYSRAGYTTLFCPGCYRKRLGTGAMPDVSGISIRRFVDGDAESLVSLFEETYSPFFGLRRKTASGWQRYRQEILEQNPDRIAVAEGRDGILGWSGNFDQWVGLVSEVWVKPCANREEIAQALLSHLEGRMIADGLDEAHLWASPDDVFTAGLAGRNGYAFSEQRVFMLRILDLPVLLRELLPLYNRRATDPLPWQGSLEL
ncbi:MAG: GNAT family N-acetyltransferase, partial [Candidatus Latescibacteria bacterium]|nr:GNAT family N-acetyltransferase [Candidatus Latescibacterota bacterium]